MAHVVVYMLQDNEEVKGDKSYDTLFLRSSCGTIARENLKATLIC